MPKIIIKELRVKNDHSITGQFLAFFNEDEANDELESIRESSRGTEFENDFDNKDY